MSTYNSSSANGRSGGKICFPITWLVRFILTVLAAVAVAGAVGYALLNASPVVVVVVKVADLDELDSCRRRNTSCRRRESYV